MLLIIFPSEQIAYLQQLKDQNIYPQTLCLYPRGRHELDNLIWALKHKLIFSICLPEKLERKLKKKLESAGLDYGRDYMFVAPHRVHMCHFFRQSK